jgi:hypothetical protein
MKDHSTGGADWGFYFENGGTSQASLSFSGGGGYSNSTAWHNGTPVSVGWHSFSICTNNNDIVYGIWYDGARQTFNSGSCAGKQTCTGLNLFGQNNASTQPLDINAYTNGGSGLAGVNIIHGAPLISTIGSNGLPPTPPGGWNSP